MGNGSKLPLALIVALSAGCYDFAEPAFPERGAPAVFHANIRVTEQGGVHLQAFLTPGIGTDGFTREVDTEAIVLMGSSVVPWRVGNQQLREYADTLPLPDRVGVEPITLSAPRVRQIQARPPSIHWFVPQRLDPDTIVVAAGYDIVLNLLPEAGTSVPAPSTRVWTLQIAGDSALFHVGSSGLVPEHLRIPAHWLPRDADGEYQALLTSHMGGVQRPAPGDYMANINLDTRLTWIIRVR